MEKLKAIEKKLSIILPAKNEEGGLALFLPRLKKMYPDAELIVVNDGSTDKTLQVAEETGARVVSHSYSKGNGSAIKTGARTAKGEILVFMDADGQHHPEDIQKLLEKYLTGYDLVVGARGRESQASGLRAFGNGFYNVLASKIVGHKIQDLTSGFRLVNAEKFREFLFLLPNGFSYPTTSTMAFFRAGYSVAYVDIKVTERVGDSHINLVKDGVRFLLIIFKVGTLFSPLKIFFPISVCFFFLGLTYYSYTYMSDGRFTNMGMLLFVTSLLVFLMGFISEQVTALLYKDSGYDRGNNKKTDDQISPSN